MNFYASSLFPERCDRLLFVIVTMPESVHLHDYSIPVDDMDNHLGTWSLLRLFPTFSRSRPPDNRITHAGGGKGDRPLVIPCQDSKKEPHHFTQPCGILQGGEKGKEIGEERQSIYSYTDTPPATPSPTAPPTSSAPRPCPKSHRHARAQLMSITAPASNLTKLRFHSPKLILHRDTMPARLAFCSPC